MNYMFDFATEEEEEHLCSKKKNIGEESYGIYATRVVTSLNYYLSMYFIKCMKEEQVKVPKQLQQRLGMTFPSKMKVSNIGTYKQSLTSFVLNKKIGRKFRTNEARRRVRDV